MKHTIKLTQVFRVEKSLTLDVDAPDQDEALRMVDERDVDIPTADDDTLGVWSAGEWVLQNEEVIAL